MRFAFDVDGVVTRYPAIFIALGKSLRAAGHEVFLLTANTSASLFGDRVERWPFLANSDRWYDEALTFDLTTADERGQIAVDRRETINAFKIRLCKSRDIAVLFDDSKELAEVSLETPVFLVRR